MLKKPQNVYMPIDRLQAKVLKRKDPVKKAEWVDNFVLALSEEAEDPFAKELLEKAQFDYYKDTLRTWRLKAKKSLSFNGNEPSDKQIHEWCCEEYGDEYIEALHLLSKNSKRFSKKIQNLLSNNPQDAPNGNNGDCDHSRESASPDSTTSCGNNSRGSARPSTDGDTRKDSHGHERAGNSVTLESGTSVEKSTQNDQRRAGGVSPLSVSTSSSPSARSWAVDVLNLAYAGEFQNVKLTQEQYNELGVKFGNQQKLNRAIDSLSSKLENNELNPPPKNHYAVLVKWAAYRDDMDERKEEEESKPKMTNMEKSWIAAMKRVEAM